MLGIGLEYYVKDVSICFQIIIILEIAKAPRSAIGKIFGIFSEKINKNKPRENFLFNGRFHLFLILTCSSNSQEHVLFMLNLRISVILITLNKHFPICKKNLKICFLV